MDQVVAVIGQHPFRVAKAFHADGMFATLIQFRSDLLGDGLDLPRIATGAHHKEVGKRGNLAKVENPNVDRFFRFGGADCGEPGRGRFRCGVGLKGGVTLLSDN